MTNAEIQLQNALNTTFLANLAFLSEYDNELYQRVDELSRLIELGKYKEKYLLEFIETNGDFDIYDILNNEYLYNKKPLEYKRSKFHEVQFDEKKSILNLSPEFLTKERIVIEQNIDKFSINEITQYNELVQNDMWEYANELGDFLEDKSKNLIEINKFIFLGTLLGRHIPKIAEKIDAKMYLVFEKNLEIFRLSLFTVDYTILAKKGVIFSVMDKPNIVEKKIHRFLTLDSFDNNIIKFSTTNINIGDYIDKLLSQLMTLDPGIYNYYRYLYVYNYRTIININKYKMLSFKELKKDCNFFNNLPVLFCAAGPSLDDNLDWIRENQNNFFIVTVGSSFMKLLNNDINVDMITTLDEQELLNEMQFSEQNIKKIKKDTIILASCITSKNVLEKLSSFNLYLYEVFNSFHYDEKSFSGFSIGEITVDLLLQMNVKTIYMIGLDLALNQNTGGTHSNGANSGIVTLDLLSNQDRDTFDFRKSLIKVKGNFSEKVYTTSVFFSSIKSLENILLKEKKVQVFNLSNHGAYFIGSTSLKIKDIKTFRVNYKKDKLLDLLNKNSFSCFSEEIKEKIFYEIKFIKRILKKDLEILNKSEINSFSRFLYMINKIMDSIYNEKFFNLYRMLNNYLEFLVPYLKYHFNNKDLILEDRKLKNIKRIFQKQIDKILDDYLFCLEKI